MPIEVKQKKEIKQMRDDIFHKMKLIFETTYTNDYTGKVMYKQYSV